MYVYVGKLDWQKYAQNECITLVFHSGVALLDPVSLYWQWTIDGQDVVKKNHIEHALITTVSKATSDYVIRFATYYSFEATISSDFAFITLTMSDPKGTTSKARLSLEYADLSRIPSAQVFTGKIAWSEFSVNEMASLIVPGEIGNGEPIILSHQWTKDGSGNPKVKHVVKGTMRDVVPGIGNSISGKFDDGYYKYDFRLGTPEVWLSMTDPSGVAAPTGQHQLWQTDSRDLGIKKALIVRFNTGMDTGIFKIKDMLLKHLGFADKDIQISYFDIDPPNGPRKATLWQEPPTVANFKARFTELCKSARPGDVRFVYIDAHGTTFPDAENSGEVDDNDEGWVLAENDDGTRKAILSDDWLGQAIRENLAKGANLTILTSSCMGGGMLDTHRKTPGILLAGCHETQFNVKALKGMDPWIIGITTCIKNHVRRKRGMPTYATIYSEAKNFIRAQLANGQLGPRYKGPSPKEWEPIPRNANDHTSNQDPQMVYDSGYIDPDQERFLCPFAAWNSGEANGGLARFPKDEYAHSEL
ncbi:hypothetical protein JDV02_003814 [Purpureocillium takamizusanense]|uniref:Uncharacterized protein n=1 Tax=Purpureocillium takamizusanense TaxID=2060973 RepID=A0A9Q8QEH5_9HYPO|nr:uncharacterized protein JDV02_003814 [Purpureocillium takamizusanense]UNI17474.1 hypothetical protein JDV02_003814 [Purpureocillium takamizusanense]